MSCLYHFTMLGLAMIFLCKISCLSLQQGRGQWKASWLAWWIFPGAWCFNKGTGRLHANTEVRWSVSRPNPPHRALFLHSIPSLRKMTSRFPSFLVRVEKTGTTSWSGSTTARGSMAFQTPSPSAPWLSSSGTTSTILWWSTTPCSMWRSRTHCPASNR